LLVTAGGTDVAAPPSPPPRWGQPGVAGPDDTPIRIAFWARPPAAGIEAVDDAAAAAGPDPAPRGAAPARLLPARPPPPAAPPPHGRPRRRGRLPHRAAHRPPSHRHRGRTAHHGQRGRPARPARGPGRRRPLGPGARRPPDARGQGPVRPRAPPVPRPLRR